jgi:DNA-binding transcriptional regulator GbsR (MarR family)
MEHVSPQRAAQDAARDPLDEFVEQMGLFAQEDNQPRISGRIVGLFLAEDRVMGLRELAERLQVSRASVSTNVRNLAQFGFLERVAVPGDRQDYYRLSPNRYARMMAILMGRMRRTSEIINGIADRVGPDNAAAAARLKEFARFQQAAAENLADFVRRYTASAERA